MEMKLIAALAVAGTAQYCGPDAMSGGAYWPGHGIDQPCGIHYVDKYVGPNQKCTLTINSGVAYPHFITLGGVFVTSQMSPGDYQYYFHTYDQFAGANGGYAAAGVDVTIFWHNPSFPDETTECLNADQVCITCQPETTDVDGDGMAGPVPGVYLGNFMHDFRHAKNSCVNVPIANSDGHKAGTVYTVTLFNDYAQAVPIEQIKSHYGHKITASGADGMSSTSGTFDLHVGCTDFEGQFLYFSVCHATAMESSGWFSSVTASTEGTANCYATDSYDNSYAAPAQNYQDPYASNAAANTNGGTWNAAAPAATSANKQRPNKKPRPNKNRPNKQNRLNEYGEYDAYAAYDDSYDYNNGTDYSYNYRK